MPTADEIFGSTYPHVPYWYCTEHRGIADDTDEYLCDRAPLWLPWRRRPATCHLYQLGTHIDGDAG